MKGGLVVLLLFLSLVIVVSAEDYIHPFIAFCEHRGYTAILNPTTDTTLIIDGICLFNDNENCTLSDFYYNRCKVEYQIDIPCREEGEVVFPNFENCCENLEVYEPDYVLGQPTCVSIESKISTYFFPKIDILWLLGIKR